MVAYFTASAGRVTERAAKTLAGAIGVDLFEIKPVELYTEADINRMNPLSRCNREKIRKKDVPVEGHVFGR